MIERFTYSVDVGAYNRCTKFPCFVKNQRARERELRGFDDDEDTRRGREDERTRGREDERTRGREDERTLRILHVNNIIVVLPSNRRECCDTTTM